MEIEVGNLHDLPTDGTGWVLGFSPWTRETLRQVSQGTTVDGLCLKWMRHEQGHPRGRDKPISVGRTLSVLVSEGEFVLEFAHDEHFANGFRQAVLTRCGDFVAWGPGVHHRWAVLSACTIMTLRWNPSAAT